MQKKRMPVLAMLALGMIPSTSVHAADPVFEANPMQKQIEAAVYDYWFAVQALDPIRFGNNFAPDGALEDPVGTQVVSGRQAITGFFGGLLQTLGIGRATPRIKDMFVGAGQSTEVMVRWELTLYTKQTGKRAILNGIGLFKFKPITPGVKLQLESVREFWDPVELMSQLQ